jgi:hypothetical protein
MSDQNVNEKSNFLGPDYKYYEYIRTPKNLGMGKKGSFSQLEKDIAGLISYVELLVTGKSKASKTGQPLGPQFFLKTKATCLEENTDRKVSRYIYINHKPTGNIPFISDAMGVNFKDFRGLIPGSLENLKDINPFSIISAFQEETNPKCREIEMDTTPTEINNFQKKQKEFVTINDIKNMDPCLFTLNNKKNPVTNERCVETFTNLDIDDDKETILFILFYSSIGILGIYILINLLKKIKKMKH